MCEDKKRLLPKRPTDGDLAIYNGIIKKWELINIANIGGGGSNVLIYCGQWSASTGAFPTTGGTGVGGAIKAGNFFVANDEGFVESVDRDFKFFDIVFAKVDNPTQHDWGYIEGHLGYIAENTSHRVSNLSYTNPMYYPNVVAVNAGLATKVSSEPGKSLITDAERTKLNAVYEKFKGTFTSLEQLQDAWPVGESGWEAQVDPGVGTPTKKYIWDANDNQWVQGGGVTAVTFSDIGGSPGDNAALLAVFAGFQPAMAGKSLSKNDFDDIAKAKVESLPASPGLVINSKLDGVDILNVNPFSTVTINGLVCQQMVLDFRNRTNAQFKYVGNASPLGIVVLNAPEGAQGTLEIQRTNNAPVGIRFSQGTNLMNGSQRINGGQNTLWTYGTSDGSIISTVLDFQIINRDGSIRQLVSLKEQSSLLDVDYDSVLAFARGRGDKLPSVPFQILQNNLMVGLKAAASNGLAGYGDILNFANDITFSSGSLIPGNLGFSGIHWTNTSLVCSRSDLFDKSLRGVRPLNGLSKIMTGLNLGSLTIPVERLGVIVFLDNATPVASGQTMYINTDVNSGNGTYMHLMTGPTNAQNGSRFYSTGDPVYSDASKRPIGTGYWGAEFQGLSVAGSKNFVMYNHLGDGVPETRTPGTKGGNEILFGTATSGSNDNTVVMPMRIWYDTQTVNRAAMIAACNAYLTGIAAL